MKIGIASDHRGYEKKEELKCILDEFDIVDYGCFSSESVDYPKYAYILSKAVINKDVDLGIIMCATGIGVSIACNKFKKIRCAKIDNIKDAKFAKEHNNANILAFSADNHKANEIKEMILKFVNSTVNLDKKYIMRIKQVEDYEDINES